MKNTKLLAVGSALAAALVLLPSVSSAHGHGGWHHGGGVRWSVGIGVPLGYYGPRYYPYGYPYYYPAPAPVVIAPVAPTTYVEQAPAVAAAPQDSGVWYYCGSARAYYPYVKDCPGGWQQVPATPAR